MADASVPVTAVVDTCGADVATGGWGAGGRVGVVNDRDEGADAALVGVSLVDLSPLPPRVAYTPSTAAATASTPTADARIGTVRDFRWGRAVVASPLRSCVRASGSTAPRFGDAGAARVGAEAG